MDQAQLSNPFLYLQRNADSNPRGIFVRSAEQTLTNAEAVVEVKRIAYELRRLGVRAGQVVALDLPDQLSILFTEALYHEAAVSTVLPDGHTAEGVFTVDWVLSSRRPAVQAGAQLVHVDARMLQQITENPYGIRPSDEPIDTLRIVFSSGTTGTPHAIALPRALEHVMQAALASWFTGGPMLNLMDTGTAAGIGELYISVKGNQPYLSAGGAKPADIIRLAVQGGATRLRGSAAQIAAVVGELEAQQRTLPGIQSVTVAGTSLPTALADRVRTVTEGCVVISSYGSTEAGAASVRAYKTDDPFDVGHAAPGSVIEIVDENDAPQPAGVVGRIRYRAPGMATGYLGDAPASARAFRDGWFYPGDLGVIRDDGGLSLRGRESEVLNAGGVKIDPNRIDHLASANDHVIDACSFEYTTASGVTAIGLALVAEDQLDVEALVRDLTAALGGAAPTLVARVDSIARTATGKPLRRELAARYSQAAG